MKTSKFNKTSEQIQKVIEQASEKDTLFVLHGNLESIDLESGFSCSDDNDKDLSFFFYTIISQSLQHKGDKGFDRLTQAILFAIDVIRSEPMNGGLELRQHEMKAFLALNEDKGKGKKESKKQGCDGCPDVATCLDDDAIAYRKAHGIPRPKKGKARKVDVN